MKRRNFLRAMSALSLPALTGIPSISAEKSSFASLVNPNSDRVLVIVHLFGGNDGLNTLVPIDKYGQLERVREQLIIPQADLLNLTPSLGLHPRMTGMKEMFDNDQLGIVQSVGYPNQNRSHFRSTDIWNTASRSEDQVLTGWLGRHFDQQYPGYPDGYPNAQLPDPPAISLGNISHPNCEGSSTNYSFAVQDPRRITTLTPGGNTPLPMDAYGQEVEFIRTTIEQTNVYGQLILNASNNGRNAVSYPRGNNILSKNLSHVARLISGGLKTKVYSVYLSGFDNHANQVYYGNTSNGAHAELLQKVSEAISAFQADLETQGLSERVLGMTFSEFGRRIRNNDSVGTDHGDAAPMFFFGGSGCLAGNVVGESPDIDPEIDQFAGVPMQYDFRDVYGSILVDWFQASETQVRNVLYQDFQRLPILEGCQAALPVELVSFTAQAAEKSIQLTWRTSLEDDNAGFTVERSTDGQQFTRVGWVSAAPPTTSGERSYEYTDREVRSNVLYYYRLRQEDFNGRHEYSQIRSAKLVGGNPNEWLLGPLFPNPATVETNFTVTAPKAGNLAITIYDTSARMVFTESKYLYAAGETQVGVKLQRLNAGAYIVRIETPDGQRHQRKLLIN